MKLKLRKVFSKTIVIALIISLTFLGLCQTNIINLATLFRRPQNAYNSMYRTISDPNTMDSYQDLLLSNKNGSRYAGRIWSDKTVLTEDLTLDVQTDGINGLVTKKSDFLHVFSALGSSLKISQPAQLDVMFLIDISGSMGKVGDEYASSSNFSDTPMYKTITSVNKTIDTLLSSNSNSRFGVVVYGATAQVLIPLGNYTKVDNSPFLKVEYLDSYGSVSPQGIHFTLTASFKDKNNKSNEYYVDNSGETSNELHKKNGSGNRQSHGTGGQTTGLGTKDSPYHVGHITNQQAGLAAAMDQFITGNEDTTWKAADNNLYSRIPALIHLSDGQASDIAWIQENSDSDSENQWQREASNWNNVNWKFDLAYNSTNNASPSTSNYYNANQLSGLGNASPIIFQTLMTAAYYKSAVDAYYASSGYTDMSGSIPTLNCFSIYASDSSGYKEMEDTQIKGTINAILNPSVYFYDLGGSDDVESSNLTENDSGAKFIDTAYELYKLWLKGEAKHTFELKTTSGSNTNTTNDIKIPINVAQSQLDDDSGAYSGYAWSKKITATTINKNIYYVPKDNFFDTDFTNVDNVLDGVIKSAVKNAFVPIGGVNDAGTSDSLTFVDPIGQYMEIKDGSVGINGNFYDMDLLLFGKHHQLKKSAIYNYEFNITHRGPEHNSDDLNQPFIPGWYDKEGNFLEEGNWEKGDTYYIDSDTIKKYVQNLDEKNITAQQKNTIYTIYSFVEENSGEDQNNPCYEDKNLSFKLNDIRVWVEDTGKFEDESSAGSPDLGFDKAIYVNIPVNALPVEIANIELGVNGKVKSYDTNLNEKVATPFRLFYGIGLEESIFTEDGLDVDLAKVSQEYIKNNKDEDIVYFYSNYYSKTNYDGYVTDTRAERTRGDAYFSFSPDTTNRYYIYQNSLTLYEITGADQRNENGLYDEINIEDDGDFNSFKDKHPAITSSDKIKAESWYYIVIDYYLPNKDTIMRTAVPREGKEFGLGEDSVNVNVENQLCWYSDSTKQVEDFKLNSSKPSGEISDWTIATKTGGLRVGDMAQSLKSKSKNTTETANNFYLPTISKTTGDNLDDSDDVVVINAYLGNNGRIEVNDSLILIAKNITTDELGEKTVDKEREYEFTLKIDGHEGDYQAIKAHKNPYSNAWQLRVSTIDLLTDNNGFLQDTNNNIYVFEQGGKQYNIYIGDNTEIGDTGGKYVFRVYSAIDNDNTVTLKRSGMTTYVTDESSIDASLKSEKNKYKNVDDKHTLGSIDVWIDKVYLVPVSDVEDGSFNNKEISKYEYLSEFVVTHLDSMKEGANELSSDYATETAYLTTEIKFGYSESNKPGSKPDNWTQDEWDTQAQNVAKFKLKADEGILISGLKASTNYKITENITKKDNEERYYFDHIDVNDEASIKKADKTVTGVVTANYVDEVVYTNIYYAPVSLSISKVVEGALAESNKEWEFTVKLTPKEGIVLGEEYDYTGENIDGVDQKPAGKIHLTSEEDGSYTGTVSLKHGQTVTINGLPEGTKYSVSETSANLEGYTTKTVGSTEGTLDIKNPSSTVKFRNIKLSSHNLTISKVIEGEKAEKDKDWTFEITLTTADDITLDETYKYTGSKEGNIKFTNKEGNTYVGEIKLKAGETVTIEGLPERTSYEVVEKEKDQDGYKTYTEKETGILKDNAEEKVKFTNVKYSLHNLTIEKVVTGGAGDKEKSWEFEIVLTPADDVRFATSYNTSTYTGVIKTEDSTLTLTNDGKTYKGTVSLKSGQKIIIKDIPERTQYSVVEKKANENEYKTTVKGNSSGILTQEEEKVTFTNRKLSKHTLSISKTTDGALVDKNRDWTFKVTLTPGEDVELAKSYNYTGSKDGVLSLSQEGDTYTGTITLKTDEEVTISDLPEGTVYKVEEVEANLEGYTTKVSGSTEGTLSLDNNAPKAEFKNIKLSKHSLTISKEVLGKAGDKEKEWNFTIKLTPREGITLEDTYPVVTGSTSSIISPVSKEVVTLTHNSDNTSTIKIKLKHGQSLTINDLPEETSYEIEEVEANDDGYITKTVGNVKGTLKDTDGESVKFINKKPSKNDLSISKLVTGGLGDKNKVWTFEITLTPDEDVTLLTEYSLEGIEEKKITLEVQPDGSSKGTIKLKSGETAVIKGLPENTTYKVVEKEANEDDYITTDNKTSEGLLDVNKKVEFVNTKLASYDLTIGKKVYGNLGDKEQEWNFKITLYAPKIKDLTTTYSYGLSKIDTEEEEEPTKGTLTLNKVSDHYEVSIKLKDNEKMVIKDLLEDTKYEITEVEANTLDYETTIDGEASGTLSSKTKPVIFKNAKFSKHDLKIEGSLKGNNTDPNKEWTLDVTIKPDPNANMKDTYVWVDENGEEHDLELTPNEDGTFSGKLKLKGNSSGTIKDLPYGSEFEVKVEEAGQDGYKTTIDEKSGTLTEDETVVHFTNEKNVITPNTFDGIVKDFIIVIICTLVILSELVYIKVRK